MELLGPLPPDSCWQAKDDDAFGLSDFAIDWKNNKVTCPQGKTSSTWRENRSEQGLPRITVAFLKADCTPCPSRPRCTRSATSARGLTFRPQAQMAAQQAIRVEQQTDAWRDRYGVRSGVEGTIAQATRRCGARHARYRGLGKVHLQHVLTAMALNFVRVDAWLNGTLPGGSWTSRLTRLRQELAPV